MENNTGNKAKKILAVIGVVFMGIFSVAIALFFGLPKFCHGLFGYISMASAIGGAACFVVVKYVFREEKDYLPKTDEGGDDVPNEPTADDGENVAPSENSEAESENDPEPEKPKGNG